MNDSNIKFLTQLRTLNPKLKRYGFVILPYMTGKQVKEIELALTNSDVKKLKEIYYQYVFQPINRSFFTFRFQNLPILEEYSHLYQMGVIHYYNYEQISSILLSITCLEGVLRRLFGKQLGDRLRYVDINSNLDLLKNDCKISQFQLRYEFYLDSLKGLFENLFKNINQNSDVPFNELNRHIIIHAMKPDCFLLDNAIRLICILDLICEMQSLITNKEVYSLIPAKFESDKLTIYYKKIFTKTMNLEQKEKLNFLKTNKKFKIN